MPTGDDYSIRTLDTSYPIWDSHLFIKPKPYYVLVTLTEHGLFTEISITKCKRFQQNMGDGCGMQAGDADSSGHLVSSHVGLAYTLLVETNPFPNVVIFFGRSYSNIPRYFLDFALKNVVLPSE